MVSPPRGLRFGSAAEDYERFRPGYPDDLPELLTALAGGPLSTAVEVGAGTGKATRVLARAGIEVVAVEPDAGMLAVLVRECAGLPVRAVLSTFEALDVERLRPVDLLFAAAAWHWTDPAGRLDRAAALLRPGGLFASVGGPLALGDPGLAAAEADAVRSWLPDGAGIAAPSPDVDGIAWPGNEFLADARFGDVTQRVLRRRPVMGRDAYLGHLHTVSAYRLLAEPERAAALAAVGAVLPDRFEVNADLVLHTARRV